MKTFAFIAIAIVVATLLSPSSATVSVVVDVDGTPDSLVALATLVEALPKSRDVSSIAMVTVTGVGWSSTVQAQDIVKRLLVTLGQPDVPVYRGASRSLADAINGTTGLGDCVDSFGVPLTPAEAANRQAAFSRLDVDEVFGGAMMLPQYPNNADPGTSTTGQAAFLQLIERVSQGIGRIHYVALAGLTNLASALRVAKLSHRTSQDWYSVATGRITAFIYDNGANIAFDPVAAEEVLTAPNLHRVLYTPTLFQPVTFDESRWRQFNDIYTRDRPGLTWIREQCLGRYRTKLNSNPSEKVDFFKAFRPGGALVVLTVVHPSVKTAFAPFLGEYRRALAVTVGQAPTNLTALNNGSAVKVLQSKDELQSSVVGPSFVAFGDDDGHRFGTEVVDRAADATFSYTATTLLEAFWSNWVPLMRAFN